jgi:DNA-binding CsgD family transcriptional regulator
MNASASHEEPTPEPSPMFRAGLVAIARELQRARDFVEVGVIVCERSKDLFDSIGTSIVWLSENGRPLMSVDDLPVADEHRIHYFRTLWATNKFLRELQLFHEQANHTCTAYEAESILAELGYQGPIGAMIAFPIIEPGGVIGFMRYGLRNALTEEVRADLNAVATQVSVRLAQIGLRAVPENGLPSLSVRQFEVAELATRGLTNSEIGGTLEVSENTIKKHLKDVFDRLQVSSRAELASLIAKTSPRDDLPPGVTRRGSVTITKAPLHARRR